MFENIIGHSENKKFLQRLASQKERPHALLFYGPKGIGKRLMAIEFAGKILCGARERLDTHPDFLTLEPDPEKKMRIISVEQMRELGEQAAFGPVRGEYKLCLIDEADTMNPEAANAFLKLLEEPPRGWMFILVAEKRELLLPTILSRLIQVRFYPLTAEETEQALKEKGIDSRTLQTLARLADGSPGTALAYFERGILEVRQLALEYVRQIPIKAPACYLYRKEYFKLEGSEEAQIFAGMTEYLLRDMLFCRLGLREQLYNPDLEKQLAELSRPWREAELRRGIIAAAEAAHALARHVNAKPVFDILTFRLNAGFSYSDGRMQ